MTNRKVGEYYGASTTIWENWPFCALWAIFNHNLQPAVWGNCLVRLPPVLLQRRRGHHSCKRHPHLANGSDHVDLIGVNFDYTQNHADLAEPIPPAKWRNFDASQIIEKIEFQDHAALNSPIYANGLQVLRSPLYHLASEYIAKKPFYQSRVSGLLKSNLALIARTAVYTNSVTKSELLADKVIQHINRHYRDDITNQSLGKLFGYHPNHLNRIVVQQTGMSVHHYLISCRINAAIELLQASDIKAAEIAEAVGFKDISHFLKYFKKATGKTTRDFRKQQE